MKRLTSAVLGLGLGLLLLLPAGCNNRNQVTYSGLEAGTVRSGVFTTDDGIQMNIVGNEGKYDVTTDRRVLVKYTTYPVTDAANIDIDLLTLWDAQPVASVPAATISDNTVDTPVRIANAWLHAGYLNLLATLAGEDISRHTLQAAYTVSADGIVLRLFHDGTADPTATSDKVTDLFACMPLEEAIQAYKHYYQTMGKEPVFPIPVLLQWTWYVLASDGPVTLYERKGTYTPSAAK